MASSSAPYLATSLFAAPLFDLKTTPFTKLMEIDDVDSRLGVSLAAMSFFVDQGFMPLEETTCYTSMGTAKFQLKEILDNCKSEQTVFEKGGTDLLNEYYSIEPRMREALEMFVEELQPIFDDLSISDLPLFDYVTGDIIPAMEAMTDIIASLHESMTEESSVNFIRVIKFLGEFPTSLKISRKINAAKLVAISSLGGLDPNKRMVEDSLSNKFISPLSGSLYISDMPRRKAVIDTLLAIGADMFQVIQSSEVSFTSHAVLHFTMTDMENLEEVMAIFQEHSQNSGTFFSDKLPDGTTWIQSWLRCIGYNSEEKKKLYSVEKLNFLCDRRADVNVTGWDEHPLLIAASYTYLDDGNFKILRDNENDESENKGCTLDMACIDLCAKGTDVSAISRFGGTVLHKSGLTTSTINVLCQDYKANVNAVDIFGRSPIMYALLRLDCECGKPSKLAHILELMEDEELCSCIDSCIHLVKAFISNGADLNIKDEDGVAALHLATFDHRVLDVILKRGKSLDINTLDKYGACPLHYAVFAKEFESVKSLLKHGAKCTIEDCKGRTPQNLAEYFGLVDLVEVLRNSVDHFSSQANEKSEFDVRLMKCERIDTDTNSETKDPLAEKLLEFIENMDEPMCDSILKSPSFVCGSDGEASEVKNDMMEMINRVSQRMGEIRPEYSSTIKLRGSSAEGTKVGFPDEFDFNLTLRAIKDPIYSKGCDCMSYNYNWILSDLVMERKKEDFRPVVSFHRDFLSTLMFVFDDCDFWKGLRIKFCGIRMGKVGPMLILNWNGAVYKNMRISADIVPYFPTDKDAPFIPMKWPMPVTFQGCELFCTLDRGGSKSVSYSEIEAALMSTLPHAAKESYKLAKAIRSPYLSHACTVSQKLPEGLYSSFLLKNALMMEFRDVILDRKEDVDSISRLDWLKRIYTRLNYATEIDMMCPEEKSGETSVSKHPYKLYGSSGCTHCAIQRPLPAFDG